MATLVTTPEKGLVSSVVGTVRFAVQPIKSNTAVNAISIHFFIVPPLYQFQINLFYSFLNSNYLSRKTIYSAIKHYIRLS